MTRRDHRHFVGFRARSSPAADADVLAVGAVGAAPDPVWTVQQGGLRSLAVDVVQEDQSDALAERPVGYDLSLSADHLRMLLVPVVVTHRPPVAVVEDLHPTLPGTVSSDQAHHPIWNRFGHPSILHVVTVVLLPVAMGTLLQKELVPALMDVPVTQLSAHHLGVSVVPLVVADGAPPPRVKHLHSTFKVFLAADQSQRRAAA
ncbi:hypothetical protein EYF80_021363 [Liparis tanakae]|uniref:Uncharacterized protein n=1 Tax=Liparis tanakae TaxID=230148 RepID=A0A4Z2HU78_9TELE|nr:hypothetical protein EYF80_021363 [Liparis tanakae]